jgi:hypothetical protein
MVDVKSLTVGMEVLLRVGVRVCRARIVEKLSEDKFVFLTEKGVRLVRRASSIQGTP